MKNVTLKFVFDRINETGFRGKKQGKKYKETGLLQIEVRQDGTSKRSLISANIRIRPDQFSDKNGFTCKNHLNAKSITGKAVARFREIEAFVLSDKCQSLEMVKLWDKPECAIMSIADFIEKDLIRRNPSLNVIEYNHSFLRRLSEFGKINYFDDLNYTNIIDFDAYLRRYITSEPTLYRRHSLFKGYIEKAIKMGVYNGKNPYDLFDNKKGKSKDPIFLTEIEIEKIKAYSPDYGYLERTRDLYLFQCYTGLAYIDLMNFCCDSVIQMDGNDVIRSSRQKTDENFISLFLPEAKKIAEKYKFELPRITNQKYNQYLKEVAIGAGVNKQLTSHSARHTFATYLLNNDVPIESVARALGHANIKQTQHYARLLGKKVIDDMKKLL